MQTLTFQSISPANRANKSCFFPTELIRFAMHIASSFALCVKWTSWGKPISLWPSNLLMFLELIVRILGNIPLRLGWTPKPEKLSGLLEQILVAEKLCKQDQELLMGRTILVVCLKVFGVNLFVIWMVNNESFQSPCHAMQSSSGLQSNGAPLQSSSSQKTETMMAARCSLSVWKGTIVLCIATI